MATTYKLNKFCDVTRLLLLQEDIHFIDQKSVLFCKWDILYVKKFYTCPSGLYTLGSWSAFESYTIVGDYNETCRLCNICKLYRVYVVQTKTKILDSEIFVTLTLEDFYAPTVSIINMINGKILALV